MRTRPKLLIRRLVLALTLVAALTSVAGAATADPVHPRLLFDASGVSSLQSRVTSGVPAQAWSKLRFKADYYLTSLQKTDTYAGGQNQMPTYLLDLSMAYVLSGDSRYGRFAIDLMLNLAANGWPAWLGPNAEPYGDLGRGDLSRGVALAFDWTYPLMTPGERATIVSTLVAELPALTPNGVHENTLFSCLEPDWWGETEVNNWVGVCGGGNGLLLMAIEGETGAGDLSAYIAKSRTRVLQHLAGIGSRKIYGSNGDGYEGVTYAMYGLKNTLPFAYAWQRLRGENLLDDNPGLVNVPVWLSYEQLPGQGARFVPRNDSGTPVLYAHELVPLLFELRPDGITGRLWDHTAGPQGDNIFETPYPPVLTLYDSRPDEQYVHFFGLYAPEVFTILYYRSPSDAPRMSPSGPARFYPEHGLVDVRTGWGANDVISTFEARHNSPGGHQQMDVGSFTIYGYGAKFAVDSGYSGGLRVGTSTLNDNWAAAGHNVPILDGARYSQDGNAAFANVQTIPVFLTTPEQTLVGSDLRSAYSPFSPANVPAADRTYLVSHTPGEPIIVLVADTLNRDNGAHEYEWRMHTDIANSYTQTTNSSFMLTAASGATMTGAVAESNGTRVVAGVPWYKPVFTVDQPYDHLIVSSRDALLTKRPTLDHLAGLALAPAGEVTTALTETATGGNVVRLTWDTGTVFAASASRGSAGVQFRHLTLTGRFAKATMGRGESVLHQGTSLVVMGQPYITASAPSSVVVGGDTVSASGSPGTTYSVYAPQSIASVIVNGAAVSFTRSGDYVTF